MKFEICTLFPEFFDSFKNHSIIKRALDKEIITINCHNIRDFSIDKHHKVDDEPYGGGAGMLMTCQPIVDCLEHVLALEEIPTKIIFLSPQGEVFNQIKAEEISHGKHQRLILLCGHYEGIDQRIIDGWIDEEISIGNYILTGGELPAQILVDAITRLQSGALGKEISHEEESFSKKFKGKKEYPQYTRPENFRGKKVPEILLSGHHAKIEDWKQDNLK